MSAMVILERDPYLAHGVMAYLAYAAYRPGDRIPSYRGYRRYWVGRPEWRLTDRQVRACGGWSRIV
jgi:hypothetical protein